MKAKQPGTVGRNGGVCRETFRDGQLSAVGKVADGQKTGAWKTYDASEKLSRTKTH